MTTDLNQNSRDHLLVDYLFDEMSEPARSDFEATIANDANLSAEVKVHHILRSQWRALDDEPVPKPIIQRIMQEAAMAVRKPSLLEQLVALLTQPAMATAMVCILVAGTAALMNVESPEPSEQPNHLPVATSSPLPSQAGPKQAKAVKTLAKTQSKESRTPASHSKQTESLQQVALTRGAPVEAVQKKTRTRPKSSLRHEQVRRLAQNDLPQRDPIVRRQAKKAPSTQIAGHSATKSLVQSHTPATPLKTQAKHTSASEPLPSSLGLPDHVLIRRCERLIKNGDLKRARKLLGQLRERPSTAHKVPTLAAKIQRAEAQLRATGAPLPGSP